MKIYEVSRISNIELQFDFLYSIYKNNISDLNLKREVRQELVENIPKWIPTGNKNLDKKLAKAKNELDLEFHSKLKTYRKNYE